MAQSSVWAVQASSFLSSVLEKTSWVPQKKEFFSRQFASGSAPKKEVRTRPHQFWLPLFMQTSLTFSQQIWHPQITPQCL